MSTHAEDINRLHGYSTWFTIAAAVFSIAAITLFCIAMKSAWPPPALSAPSQLQQTL